ncbi:Glyco transf 92 domain containing protein [Asbolus verrucosus]|uniref:Glycosyltransferase family 92 protein n=1 Tax=Asbolus verrucosus TaxID=1661398 RepID=A0A482W4N9_ASBVE|nr:Glyco transf 92 domain containing protein [Asbolus verrucosus]
MRKIFCLVVLASAIILLFLYQRATAKTPFYFPYNYGDYTYDSLKHLAESTNSGNIPDILFKDRIKKPTGLNKTCARFPTLFDLTFKNDYWQTQKTSNGTFHLFNAYWDDRNGSTIRIVGIYDQYLPKTKFYCQFWYYHIDKPLLVQSQKLFWLWRPGWGADRKGWNHPYLITCPVPYATKEVPMSVSLVENFCDKATNNLKIFHKEVEEKKNFVVCVKGLDFPYEDNSLRLAEWIELLNILGAEKVHFYEFSVHASTKKLLDYYVEQGKVEVTPLTVVGDFSNQPNLQHIFLHRKRTDRRLQEVIPYNDCLYKHLGEFKYVVLLDTDEVIVPASGTWVELIATFQRIFGESVSYMARNVYFLDSHQHRHRWFEGIPKYMHMLQHVYRAENYTKPGHFVKGFHDTGRVLALHNHYPLECLGECSAGEINMTFAHLQHYRRDCAQDVDDCLQMKLNSIVDTRVWNFKEELIERVTAVVKHLRLFDS